MTIAPVVLALVVDEVKVSSHAATAAAARCKASHERKVSNVTSICIFNSWFAVPRSNVVRLRADSNSSAIAVVDDDDDDDDVDDDKTRDSYATIAFSRKVDRGMDLALLPWALACSNVTAAAPDDEDEDDEDDDVDDAAKAPSCSDSVDMSNFVAIVGSGGHKMREEEKWKNS